MRTNDPKGVLLLAIERVATMIENAEKKDISVAYVSGLADARSQMRFTLKHYARLRASRAKGRKS